MMAGNNTNKITKYRNPLVTAISVLLLMILLESMYYGYHIMDNRTNVMVQYESEQRQRTELLAKALSGMDEEQMAEFIVKSIDTSASSWAFITRNDRLVFVRDALVTAEQAGDVLPDEYTGGGDAVVTTAYIGDGYTCGILTQKSYIWQSEALNDFEFYIIIAVIADFMVFGGMLVQFAGNTRTAYDELSELKAELAGRNEKFHEYEKLTARYEDELSQLRSGQEKWRGDYYDMDVVDALLSKSGDALLYPITYMFIRVDMEDRYYTRDEIFTIMDFVRSRTGKNHVTAEISKAHFAVIMYRTDAQGAEAVKRSLLEDWENAWEAHGDTGLHIRNYTLSQDDSPRKVFYREMERI